MIPDIDQLYVRYSSSGKRYIQYTQYSTFLLVDVNTYVPERTLPLAPSLRETIVGLCAKSWIFIVTVLCIDTSGSVLCMNAWKIVDFSQQGWDSLKQAMNIYKIESHSIHFYSNVKTRSFNEVSYHVLQSKVAGNTINLLIPTEDQASARKPPGLKVYCKYSSYQRIVLFSSQSLHHQICR